MQLPPRIHAVLGDVWLGLPPWDRRALALMGHCYTLERQLAKEFVPWLELETADRVAIVRAMRLSGELAATCAAGLERARASLDEHWREGAA